MNNKQSSAENKKSQPDLENFFGQARIEKPVVDCSVVTEKLKFRLQEKSEGKNRFAYHHGFNLKLIGVVTTIVFIMLIELLLTTPKQISRVDPNLQGESDPSWNLDLFKEDNDNSDWSIQNASYVKNYFLKTLAQEESDTANVKVFFKNHSSFDSSQKQIPTLKVSPSILKRLGFRINNGTITYEASVRSHGYLRFHVDGKHHSVTVSDTTPSTSFLQAGSKRLGVGFKSIDTLKIKPIKTTFYPVYLSDMTGKQRVRFRFSQEDQDKMSQDYFNRLVDDLVPIAVPKSEGSDNYAAIFWFKSSKELFDTLTDEPIVPLTNESAPNEIEKETNAGISLKVNQNPFYDKLNISYSLPTAENVQIDLISIDGKPMKQLVPRQKHKAKSHDKVFDLSELPSGMYLLVMTTDSNRISQRILKQ